MIFIYLILQPRSWGLPHAFPVFEEIFIAIPITNLEFFLCGFSLKVITLHFIRACIFNVIGCNYLKVEGDKNNIVKMFGFLQFVTITSSIRLGLVCADHVWEILALVSFEVSRNLSSKVSSMLYTTYFI